MTQTKYAFYNLRVSRPGKEVSAEIKALLSLRPRVLGLVEGQGYRLPLIPGYDLIRDTSTKSRANVAAYVESGLLKGKGYRWVDEKETWKRTDHPGTHEPRSTLVLRLKGKEQVIVGHVPPKTRFNDTFHAQVETFADIEAAMKRGSKRRKRLVVMDANSLPGGPFPSPTSLAKAVGGVVVGTKIDCGVAVNHGKITAKYITHVGKLRLKSDHNDALLLTEEA